MLKCPYCFEPLKERPLRCPHCEQYIIDDPVNMDFPSIDKKKCVYCGKKILLEAKFCRYCRRWVDEVDRAARQVDLDDLV